MARKKKTWEHILITGMADRGKSVGRNADGEVVFVDGAVPGDEVDILLLRKKKGTWQGAVQHFHHRSPDRITPPCLHFEDCGGCKWQHLNYQSQLQHKQQIVRDVMNRIAKLPSPNIKEIIAADPIFHYRNKMEYSFSSQRWKTKSQIRSNAVISEQGALGLHPPRFFNKVVDIQSCLLQDERGDHIRNFIRDYADQHHLTYFDPILQQGLLRNMVIRNTSLGDWMLILSFSARQMDVIEEMMSAIASEFKWINSLHYVINQKKNDTLFDQDIVLYHGQQHINEQLGDLKFKIRPKSFFQTNTSQAQQLYDVIKHYAALDGNEVIYDLYTGTGSIALYLAKGAAEVIGIEEIPDAIDDARENAASNNISNAFFYVGDVKQALVNQVMSSHKSPDVIVTDPPRMGMHEQVIQEILQLAPTRIIYISCNPATQARDIQLLSKAYEVIEMQPVDMFPHTNHIENVALLARCKA